MTDPPISGFSDCVIFLHPLAGETEPVGIVLGVGGRSGDPLRSDRDTISFSSSLNLLLVSA